ncbi:hypothetical protein DBV15_05617 [Temnothorax longispinosus]|uniref:Uncharacterized protein n=1 Tax=Temnothorax longispinosus TaxID=300112 RepID=A0A4S2JZC5_9HYME|nr:hypothetical protein DBV15_05617 [Temnothorax longispinosus]
MAISRSNPMMQSTPHCWRFALAVLHYPGDETDETEVLLTTGEKFDNEITGFAALLRTRHGNVKPSTCRSTRKFLAGPAARKGGEERYSQYSYPREGGEGSGGNGCKEIPAEISDSRQFPIVLYSASFMFAEVNFGATAAMVTSSISRLLFPPVPPPYDRNLILLETNYPLFSIMAQILLSPLDPEIRIGCPRRDGRIRRRERIYSYPPHDPCISALAIRAPRNLHRYISPSPFVYDGEKYRAIPCFFSRARARGKAEAFRWWNLESPLTSRRARTKFRGRVKLGEEIFRNLRVLFYGCRFKWKKPYPCTVPLPLPVPASLPDSTLKNPLCRELPSGRSTESSTLNSVNPLPPVEKGSNALVTSPRRGNSSPVYPGLVSPVGCYPCENAAYNGRLNFTPDDYDEVLEIQNNKHAIRPKWVKSRAREVISNLGSLIFARNRNALSRTTSRSVNVLQFDPLEKSTHTLTNAAGAAHWSKHHPTSGSKSHLTKSGVFDDGTGKALDFAEGPATSRPQFPALSRRDATRCVVATYKTDTGNYNYIIRRYNVPQAPVNRAVSRTLLDLLQFNFRVHAKRSNEDPRRVNKSRATSLRHRFPIPTGNILFGSCFQLVSDFPVNKRAETQFRKADPSIAYRMADV